MKSKIQKWGNSLALRVPGPLADELGLQRNSLVNLSIVKSKLVVAPARKERLRVEELLNRVTNANVHAEADFGSPIGREIW
jgi:antitoxin MazE